MMMTMTMLTGWAILALASLLWAPTITAQECAKDGVCDTHERCAVWKAEGECYRNENYMALQCPVACRHIVQGDQRRQCTDVHSKCPDWSKEGECDDRVVKRWCAKSCDNCVVGNLVNDEPSADSCADIHDQKSCKFWAEAGECPKNPEFMLTNCQKSCKSCPETQDKIPKPDVVEETDAMEEKDAVDEQQEVVRISVLFGERQDASGGRMVETLQVVQDTIDYMRTDDYTKLEKKIKENCMNQHKLCSFWAMIGECENNMAFMKRRCAPACKTCHLIDMAARCPPLPDAIPALKPGDLNKMFERIVETAPGNRTLTEDERKQLAADEITEYSVVVHSRPTDALGLFKDNISLSKDKGLHPWVVTFDNFIAPEECEAMIQLGYKYEYKRSADVGAQNFDGSHEHKESTGRTSENAWCSERKGCRNETIPTRIHNRMSKVLGIPAGNSEDLQILKYEVGQYYNTHHDYIPHQKDRQCGPRILTFFIYLSDVETGGGTDFPLLGLTVIPKKGRAVLWPSVYDSNALLEDGRTEHQALPVEAGTKFAANGWIHLFDYVGAQDRGCN